MASKKNKKVAKKTSKIDPLKYEKDYLTNIINKMEECALHTKGGALESYFQEKAELNRERLRNLK